MAKIIIIGGGVAGLAAGIRALQGGHEAEIVERHGSAGGNLCGWDRGGYHIDNCIHWLTGTNPVTDMYRTWLELGVPVDGEVYQGETLYTYSASGGSLSLSRDIRRLERDMRALSQGDDREITRLIRAIKAARTLCGISAESDSEAAGTAEIARMAPALLPYLAMSTGQLSERFRSPVIRGFIRSLLTGCFGAIALVIVFAAFCSGNGGIPSGGSCAVARRMEGRFRALGGVLRCGVPAVNISVDGGRARSVTLADGRCIEGDYTVLACDPACAFGRLLPAHYEPARLQRRYEDPRRRQFSSFHCAFGCDTERLPFSGDLIVDMPERLRGEFGTDYLIMREFSHEPRFAPQGHSLLQTMCFCTQSRSLRFITLSRDREAYRAEKARLAELTERAVSAQFPRLAGRLDLIDCWTPATYRRYTGAPTGSYIGFTLPSGRIPTMISPRVKGISNLFLATQWQQEPGGLPTAAAAGIAAADVIIRRELKRSEAPGARKDKMWLTAE